MAGEAGVRFVELVQTLIKDVDEKEYFFQVSSDKHYDKGVFDSFCLYFCLFLWFLQHVFPVDFGTDFDSAIQVLMWHFLSRLEHFLPIPDLQQVGRHGQSRILEVVFVEPGVFA